MGYSPHDVLEVFSLEMVERLYKAIEYTEDVEFYKETIRDLNIAQSTMPNYTKSDASKAVQRLNKFLDSINPDRLKEKKRKKENPIINLMKKAGNVIPVNQ